MSRKSISTITIKRAKTIKEYKVHAFGWDIVVPVGSHVSNNTACGPDDNYRFWRMFAPTIRELVGCANSMLEHDISTRGINIPAEYCEPWPEIEVVPISEDNKKYHEANLKLSFTEIYRAPYNLEKATETISLLKDALVELRHQVRQIPCEQYTAEMHDAMVATTKAIDKAGEIPE